MINIVNTYLQYGVSRDIAENVAQMKLTVTTFRATSNANLQSRFGLSPEIIAEVKHCITRQPIEEEVVNSLLERSNYLCCICKGNKGKSYLIHHILEYSISQDNNYSNLAVLCPTCHDLAHRSPGLTNQLTVKQILRCKDHWEKQVKKQNAESAARSGKVSDSDYLNIPRISELAYNLLGELPQTSFSAVLLKDRIISSTGKLANDKSLLERGFDAGRISYHFLQIFQELIPRINFENLDNLLSKKALLRLDLIGAFCFYVGGLYGQTTSRPVTSDSKPVRLSMRRRGFYCEWLLDPMYVTSSTALARFEQRSVYIVYGRIKSISEVVLKKKPHIKYDIRPYLVGTPIAMIDRRPAIAFVRDMEEYEQYRHEIEAEEYQELHNYSKQDSSSQSGFDIDEGNGAGEK
jgi:hypothetical protein